MNFTLIRAMVVFEPLVEIAELARTGKQRLENGADSHRMTSSRYGR
jgi:hypothetical protein